jgi:hypothetical protein
MLDSSLNTTNNPWLNPNLYIDSYYISITRYWVNAGQLSAVEASNEIGFNFGKIGSASVRSEFFIDYIHYNCTGSYSLPANWNSLRF